MICVIFSLLVPLYYFMNDKLATALNDTFSFESAVTHRAVDEAGVAVV